ncbi:hypothetical protein NLX86_33625 [Streptomyces sp. A3M-1-3]|uniref:hypothetical protein n=1 Tax=Streptomyces sp. A3M-1-3 TaxID=2962044 RepID=UPI0020B700DF|nr:hypothetical protein [Streptomyces sp. A3M-1-3]MCP3822840.1 hypothetical protein [Streptomyces sp. A3M-1-3]
MLVALLRALLIAYLAVEHSIQAWFDHLEYGGLGREDGLALLIALGAVAAFAMVLTLLSTAVIYAATSAVLQDAVLGRPAAFGTVWRRAWSRMPAVLGTVLLSSLIACAPMLVFGVVMLVLLAASAGEGSDTAGTLFGVWALLMLVSLPVTVWLWIRFSVSRTLCVPVVSRLFGRGVAVCGCHRGVRTSG